MINITKVNAMVNITNSEVYEVQGPRPNKVTVTWTIGNSCVYKCSYCPKALHDGSNPYHDVDLVLAMFNKLPKDSFCTDENLIEKLIEVSKICETRKYKEVKHQCEVYLQALKSLNEESRQTLFSMVKSDI
jgi:biotin synthase-related radical SAM superfamily protein